MKQIHLLLAFSFLFFIPLSYGQNSTLVTSFLKNEDLGLIKNPQKVAATPPLADGKSKFLGCEWNYNQAEGFSDLFNQSTPENAGKWGSVEGTRGSMNWRDLDSTYNVAKRYKMLYKHHTLIWGAQQPYWIASLDSATQRQEIEQWFSLLAQRYPDIDYIDVVNEPIHTIPDGTTQSGGSTVNYIKALGGTGKTGWDWIITSFKLARKYFPKSKLLINEYSVISSVSTTQKYLQIIKSLQTDSLIDGIGEQAHAGTTKGASTATMKACLDSLATTGLPIYITEMDIDGSTDVIQLSEMQRVFSLFWEHPAVAGVTFWGFRNGMWRSAEKAYLITPEGVERPALKWLKAYMNGTLTPMTSLTVASSNGKTTISQGDTLNMIANVLPVNTTFPDVVWTVVPSYLAKIDANGVLVATASNGAVTVTATAADGSGVTGSLGITISTTVVPDDPNDSTETKLPKIYIKDKDNLQKSTTLNSISKITFTPGNIQIIKTENNDSLIYGLSSIRYLSFKDFQNVSTSLKTVEGLTTNKITLFPNPVMDKLNISFESEKAASTRIEIIDLQGRKLYLHTLSSVCGVNDIQIAVSQFPAGLYIFRVNNGDKIESIKFIKK
jgi:endo-1,4-beta-xylanase